MFNEPDMVGIAYDGEAAGRPGGEGPSERTWLAVVVDGTAHGKSYVYPTTAIPANPTATGWYIDEVDPVTLATFTGSRTRPDGTWVETVARNMDPTDYTKWFWPIEPGVIIRVVDASPSGSDIILAHEQLQPCMAKATAVSNGLVTTAQWCNASGTSLSIYVYDPFSNGLGTTWSTNWLSGDGAYPWASVNDVVLLSPSLGSPPWCDATPRIPLPRGNKTGASTERNIELDNTGGYGRPWVLDVDT